MRSLSHSFPLSQKILLFCGGLSHGLPGVLTWQTFNIWLADLGYSKTLIGLFFFTGLPYSCKVLLSWVIDDYAPPGVPRNYPARRGWAVMMQLIMATGIVLLGWLTPAYSLGLSALLCFIISLSSSLNQIATVSHRIEILEPEHSAIGVSIGIIGYRIGKLLGRAGALYLLTFIPWFQIYPLLGLLLLLSASWYHFAPIEGEECGHNRQPLSAMGRNLLDISAFCRSSFIEPFKNFQQREKQWLGIMALLGLVNIGDSLILGMIDLFYLEQGFSHIQIASITKVLGLSFSMIGGALAIYRLQYHSLSWMLFEACASHSLAHLSLLSLCWMQGPQQVFLATTVILEHLSGGMKATLLATWVAALCHRKRYTGSQYAFFSSVKAVPFVIGAMMSGWLIDKLSWDYFFLLSFIISLPCLGILMYLNPSSFKDSSEKTEDMLESNTPVITS